jgi:twitching motility protein PilT
MELKQLLDATINHGASDLHILTGYPPYLRINGGLRSLGEDKLTEEQVESIVIEMLTTQQKDLFMANKEIDFSMEYGDKGRFRVNAYHEKGKMAAALRLLPFEIRQLDELNLPNICHRFTDLKSGLVLVTGPTGHGKSTTLAAMIEEINQSRAEHIITIEDPIEYIYKGKKSIITQREMNQDTHSWEIALRSVLREDPDVVLVGEMRDYETIAAALTVAETGHLVFATLHTNSASQTLDRIVDVFPENKQPQIRMQLSNVIEGVISQRLIPAVGGGRLPATEVLLGTPPIKANIREGETHLIQNTIQTSQGLGMMTLEKSLARLVNQGSVDIEEAQKWSLNPEELTRLVNR